MYVKYFEDEAASQREEKDFDAGKLWNKMGKIVCLQINERISK